MNPEFWHKRWADNQIGFHESQANPLLVTHFDDLALLQGARVLLPLCGKTLDIDWLLERGHRVVGAELSAQAVAQLFDRLRIAPKVECIGDIERHSAAGLDVFVGDFFQLDAEVLGTVDAVYDRAALIALPAEMRKRYVRHLRVLAREAPQLLITLEYDQQLVDGPPFAVSAEEVLEMYRDRSPAVLSRQFLPLGLKAKYPVTEIAWRV